MWIFLFAIFALYNIRKIENFDLVLLDSIHYYYPRAFLKKLRKKNGKIVTIFHEAWYEYRKAKGFPRLMSLEMGILIERFIRYSDAIFSVSNPTTRSLVNNYHVNNDKIHTIPLSVNCEYISSHFKMINPAERAYDVVFVGRLAFIKRVEDLVAAISILVRKDNGIRVTLMGGGPLKKKLERQILELGLERNIMMLGHKDEDEKFNLLNNSKIFVLPSEREGFSLSTLEAMALGCIPVVSKPRYDEVFGPSHFVLNNYNGYYYDVGNKDQLAEVIWNLLNNKNLMNIISNNAVKASSSYDVEIISKKLNTTVENLLK